MSGGMDPGMCVDIGCDVEGRVSSSIRNHDDVCSIHSSYLETQALIEESSQHIDEMVSEILTAASTERLTALVTGMHWLWWHVT